MAIITVSKLDYGSSVSKFYDGTSTAKETVYAGPFNTTFVNLVNTLNDFITQAKSLETNVVDLSTNQNQIAGTKGFTGGIYLTNSGILDTYLVVGYGLAAGTRELRMSKNTAGTSYSTLKWDNTNTRFDFTTDGTTLSQVRGLAGATGNAFTTKDQMDTAIAAVSTSTIFQQTTAPVLTAGTLWLNTTDTARPEWARADGAAYQDIQPKRYYPKVTTLTYAATLNTDASLSNAFEVTLTGNTTIANPTNAKKRQHIEWYVKQDGTGNRTVALGNKFRFGATLPSITWSTAANKTDVLGTIYDSIDDKFDVVAFTAGF